MKKRLWMIVMLTFCLLLSACRPELTESEIPASSAPQSGAGQTEQKQPQSTENDPPAEKETTTETEEKTPDEQEQPTEEETPDEPELQTDGKDMIGITETYPRFSQEELTKKAELILHGRVKAKTGELMLNPDGKRTDASGQKVTNEQITSYEVEVYNVYKGTNEKETVVVKTSNGYGLSPDLILYGEDENVKLALPLKRFDLTVGEECVMYLVNVTDGPPEADGYYPIVGGAGYFVKKGDAFKNNGALPLTNTLEQLEKIKQK